MTLAVSCLNAAGLQKKRYPSAEAAKRDLARSHRWRRRATWPVAYFCEDCRGYHLAHKGAA